MTSHTEIRRLQNDLQRLELDRQALINQLHGIVQAVDIIDNTRSDIKCAIRRHKLNQWVRRIVKLGSR